MDRQTERQTQEHSGDEMSICVRTLRVLLWYSLESAYKYYNAAETRIEALYL